MARMSAWVLVGVAAVGSACGGDGTGDGLGGRLPDGTRTGSDVDTQAPSGVTTTRTITELSLLEAQQLCEWMFTIELAVEQATVEPQCVLYAGGGSVADCEQAREACVDELAESPPDVDDDEVSGAAALCVSFLALGADLGCEASVADLEACVRADAAAYEAALSGLTCEVAAQSPSGGWERVDALAPAAACTALEEKCPTWFVEPTVEEDDDWSDEEWDDGSNGDDFACNDGAGIPASWQCDGTPDCYDGEDEDDCASATSSAQQAVRTMMRPTHRPERP